MAALLRRRLTEVTMVRRVSVCFFVLSLCFPFLIGQLAFTQLKSKVIVTFGQVSGGNPYAPLTFGPDGALYGTATGPFFLGCGANTSPCGAAFQLTPHEGTWTYKLTHDFKGLEDGAYPYSGVVFDPQGNLYGTTSLGGLIYQQVCQYYGCGGVYRLRRDGDRWRETVIHVFTGPTDGSAPTYGLVLDPAGALYGTAPSYGPGRHGVAFQLQPSGDQFTYRVLHAFAGAEDGGTPSSPLVRDAQGNLYGTLLESPSGGGAIYQLRPHGSGWDYRHIFEFSGGSDGGGPTGGLTLDSAGNLYGTTQRGGDLGTCSGLGCGVVFELSPSDRGAWSQKVLYSFKGIDGAGSVASLTFDSHGNLWGTTALGGAVGLGTLFKLAPSGQSWIETVVYNFTGRDDGSVPSAGVVFDKAGNLYGTAAFGGSSDYGVVYEITP